MSTAAGAELSALLLCGAACTLVLVVADRLHRAGLDAERSRKLVHTLMGLAAASFPWFFRDPRSVLALCALFAVLLGVGRSWRRLAAVHAVGRRTAGAVWFPVAVAIVFLAAERPAHYVLAVLVLTLADPAAALVGRAYGRHLYRVGDGRKSVEGSLAFFGAASVTIAAGLAVTTPLSLPSVMVWAGVMGGLLAAVEAASPAGSDNVLVPVGTLLLLRGAGA
jgi:phytol kinase